MSSFEALIASLEENTISTLRLPLGYDSDVPRLFDALRNNTSVEEANIDIYDTFKQRDEASQEVLELFAALSSLPKLLRLWVDSGREGSPFYALPVAALALLLQQAPQLERLGLYDVELATNSIEEWKLFEQAVGEHLALQAFGLNNCRLGTETIELALAQQEETNRENCYLLSNLLGRSLAKLPSLQWVEVTGQEYDALGELTPESLEALCRGPSLAKLWLESFDFKDTHIVAMARALETSTTMEDFMVTCELGRAGCTALAQMLFVNTSLNNLTLRLNELIEEPITTEVDSNSDATNSQTNDPIYPVAQALERNQHLEYFCLCGSARISQASADAFATLLRTNTTLLNCDIDLVNSPTISDDLQCEVDLMLKLNHFGRKRLLEGEANIDEWIQALWEVRRNLDGIYYLLSRNPMLCDLEAAQGAGMSASERVELSTYSGLSHLQFKYLMS